MNLNCCSKQVSTEGFKNWFLYGVNSLDTFIQMGGVTLQKCQHCERKVAFEDLIKVFPNDAA